MQQWGFRVRCSLRWHPDHPTLALTKLSQPSGKALLGLRMGRNATLGNSLLPAGDTLKDCHALLHELVRLDVQQVRAGQTMLSDENGLFVSLDVRQEFGGLTLESGDEFGAHEVTLQYHFQFRKHFPQRANA